MPSRKPDVLVWATAGVGDNLLTLPLLLELEAYANLRVVLLRESERELFSKALPTATLFRTGSDVGSLLRSAARGFGANAWVYPTGSSTKRFRWLNLLAPGTQTVGFTSLAGEGTWSSELGFRYTLVPDFGTRAWKNNLRLLPLLFPEAINRIYHWETFAAKMQERVFGAHRGGGGLAIHMGSNKYLGNLERYKRWPVDRFFALAKALQAKLGLAQVHWLIGPGEEDSRDELERFCRENPGHSTVLCQERFGGSLVELGRFLSGLDYLVANDSGIAHLATFTGLPMTVICSGIGQVHYTGQNGPRTQLLWEDVPCRACTVGIPASVAVRFTCPNAWICMENITVDKTFKAIHDHWLHRA